jgi:DNA-binding beta-propeller fold protein YncE
MGLWPATSRAQASLAGAVLVAVGVVVCASCTSGRAGSSATTPAGLSTRGGGSGAAVPALPARALASPACSTATAASAGLGSVRTAMLGTGGSPFGVAVTPDGRYGFAAVLGGGTGGSVIDVLRMATTASGPPVLVRSIPVAGRPLGETITPDGRYLLAADGNGAVVISVARAESGAAGAVLGMLAAPGGTGPGGLSGSAIEVATSRDGRYAFVTLEYDQRAAVFNLADAVSRGFSSADYAGSIPLGQAAVGLAVSPDGRWLYATSEAAAPAQHPVGITAPAARGEPALSASQAARAGVVPDEPPGTLTVIDVQRAETNPAHSVVATVEAGCQPVRVVTAADGTQVWVTARASDDALCFAAARLVTDPSHALVAAVRVGEAPVGLAAVRDGTLIVVADSNRFSAPGAHADLTVISVADALHGRPAIVGDIPAGMFPRDMTAAPDGTVLVSNFSSGQVETVDTATIP